MTGVQEKRTEQTQIVGWLIKNALPQVIAVTVGAGGLVGYQKYNTVPDGSRSQLIKEVRDLKEALEKQEDKIDMFTTMVLSAGIPSLKAEVLSLKERVTDIRIEIASMKK